MNRNLILVAVLTSSFSTSLALAREPASAEGHSVTKVYENILDLESQALKDLHQIQQMKYVLERQLAEINSDELTAAQRETRKKIKSREDRMWRESEQFRKLIKLRLSNVWYPPTTPPKQSPALLEITLLPTGDPVSVTISSSSGNDEYDQSILDAAKSIRRYPVPSVADTFQRHFQQITIEFNSHELRWL